MWSTCKDVVWLVETTLFSINFAIFAVWEKSRDLKIPKNREIKYSRNKAHDFKRNLILVKLSFFTWPLPSRSRLLPTVTTWSRWKTQKPTLPWSPSQPFLGSSRNAPCVTSLKTAAKETNFAKSTKKLNGPPTNRFVHSMKIVKVVSWNKGERKDGTWISSTEKKNYYLRILWIVLGARQPVQKARCPFF